jgi:hypothetical protein
MTLFVVVSGVCVTRSIDSCVMDLVTQTPLTTTNNYIHYIIQESIDLATQAPLTTTNNDIHYITQESIDLFVVVSGVCVARSIDSCIM